MPDPVRRNPVPSLLRSLMTDHLDPGYAAAARERTTAHRHSAVDHGVLIVGLLLVGCLLGVAVSHASGADGPGLQRDTLASVRDAETRATGLEQDRQALADRIDDARASALRDDGEGSTVLIDLRAAESAAGAEAVHGPGITVTVSEPPQRTDLSDVSVPSRGSSSAVVLDRDLHAVVNSLWVSGAEAVVVDDIRIGPGVTIRQAGGAMLVDNRPVFSPYAVSGIGSPGQLQARFAISDAYLRMSALSQLYGVGFDVRAENSLLMEAAAARTVRSAQQEGSR